MLKLKLTFFILLLVFISTHAQNLFQVLYQGSSDDYAQAICMSPDNGFLISGYTKSFGNGNEILFIKIDSVGNLMWSKTLGGAGNEAITMLKPTFDGGYIAVGSSSSFGINTDVIIVKITGTGILQWVKILDCGIIDNATNVTQTTDSGFVVSGGGGSNVPDTKLFVARLTKTGVVTWFKRFTIGSCIGGGIRQTSDGGFIVSGGVLGNQDVLLMKLDVNGNIQWQKTYGGANNEVSYEINITADGGFLISADSWSYHFGIQDLWLIKTTNTGVIQWTKTFGETGRNFRATATFINQDGSIVCGLRDVSSGPATKEDFFIVKITSNGNLLWVKKYGGNNSDVCCMITRANDKGYVLAGYTNGNGSIGYDVYVIKTDSNGNSIKSGCNILIPTFGTTTPIPTESTPSLTPTTLLTISTPTPSIVNRTLNTISLCQTPKADFSWNIKKLCNGATVNFYDSSLYDPVTWKWTFTGGIPATSALKNPANIVFSSTGNYAVKLVVMNAYGSDSITKIINIQGLPKAFTNFIINDSTQCLRGNNFIFNNTSSISSGNFSNLWKFGNGDTCNTLNSTYNYKTTGKFIVKLITKSDSGCIDSITKNIYVYPDPVIDFSINDSTQCFKGNNFIFTNKSYISSGTLSSNWFFGDGLIANNTNTNHSYSTVNNFFIKLLVISDKGCKDSLTKRVFLYPSPIVDYLINDTSQCLPVNNFIFTNLSSVSSGTLSSNWNFGDGNFSIIKNPLHTYTSIGSYKVKIIVITDKFCTDSLTKNIYVTQKSQKPVLSSNNPICEGDTLKIFRDSLTGLNYFWTGPNGFNSNLPDVIIPNTSILNGGNYKLFRIKNGCPSDTANINVIVNPIPDTPIVTGNFSLCSGERLQFNSFSIPGAIFYWYGPHGFISSRQNPAIDHVSETNSGNYTLYVTINNCKSGNVLIPVNINPKPLTDLGRDTVICEGDKIILYAGLFSSYIWQDSSTTDRFNVTSAGTYWVTVSNQYDCINTDTINVKTECPPSIFIPNIFTPNSDNINDTFRINGQNITEYDIIIFNRWGEEMFKSNDIKISWDGTYKGTLCSEGVYYWLVTYGGLYNGVILRKFLHGTVTLLR